MEESLGKLYFGLNRAGESMSQIARRFGSTKGKVQGLIFRYVNQKPSPNADRWTEEKLTEKWADRKKRIVADA